MSHSKTKVDDGGPAYPTGGVEKPFGNIGVGVPIVKGGMSLRDWFAGQALTGLIASRDPDRHLAQDAYAIADQMLIHRK